MATQPQHRKWRVVFWKRLVNGDVIIEDIVACDDSMDASQVVRHRMGLRSIQPSRRADSVLHDVTDGWEATENVLWHLPLHDLAGTRGAQIERGVAA